MSGGGHDEFSTTQIYIREADVTRDEFGVPFAALPADLASTVEPTDVTAVPEIIETCVCTFEEPSGTRDVVLIRPGYRPARSPEIRATPGRLREKTQRRRQDSNQSPGVAIRRMPWSFVRAR